MIQQSFSDIEALDERGIILAGGRQIIFAECAGGRYNSELCIAERDITAKPPYFEFFAPGEPVRIVFDGKGLFADSRNRRLFGEFQMKIKAFGYTTYDLS